MPLSVPAQEDASFAVPCFVNQPSSDREDHAHHHKFVPMAVNLSDECMFRVTQGAVAYSQMLDSKFEDYHSNSSSSILTPIETYCH